MERSVVILGASGLVGGEFLKLIQNKPQYKKIVTLTRRKMTVLPNVQNHRIDFDQAGESAALFTVQNLVSALGTTIKKAGSKEQFRKVDYTYPFSCAKIAIDAGVENYILVSSTGADINSRYFYSRVKAELEQDISKLPFKSIHILRPSLLLGERAEFRLSEKMADKVSAPFRGLIPLKYRPIQAGILARKIHDICLAPGQGYHVYEGEALYRVANES